MDRNDLIKLIGDILTKLDVLRGSLLPDAPERKDLDRLRSRLDLLQSELVQNEFDDRTADFKDAAAKIRSVNDDLRDTIGDIEKVADTLDILRRFVVAVDNLVSIVLPLV